MFNMESIDCKVKCYLNLFNKIRNINNNLVKYSKIIENSSIGVDFEFIKVRLKKLSQRSQTRVQQTDKQFKCFWPKCGYSSTQQYILNKHISVHSSEHKYKCDQCCYSSKTYSNLLRHKLNVHSNDR